MTQAGEKWLADYISLHSDIPEYGDMIGAMKYGIRAFVAEVESRATVECIKDQHMTEQESFPPCAQSLGHSLSAITRELLGDDR